jgi:predicted TIM-barrel fold metal-dependent hydrolase
MKKIDVYAHMITPRFKDELYKRSPMQSFVRTHEKALSDVETRFRHMDKYEGYVQVITPTGTVPEALKVKDSVFVCQIANDEMAELVSKYPDRFVAAVAALPMNDVNASLKETDRAIKELGMKGVLIYSSINGYPLDRPEYMPLYEKMAAYDLPIWIHPVRGPEVPNYTSEDRDHYLLNSTFGWPYETSLAMARLVFGGVLEKYPGIKFITHHCGGQVPYLEQRIALFYGYGDTPPKVAARRNLKPGKRMEEYFHMFYADTALYGHTPALVLGYSFFGADRLLFASDMPYAGEEGHEVVKTTIDAVDGMTVSGADIKKIYEDNARRLLHLS